MEILLSVAPSSVGVIPSCSVVRTYSKKVLGTVALEMAALGTVASRENPSTLSESPTRRCITLQVTKPIVQSSLSPPSPPPMGSDHSSDGNYVAKPSLDKGYLDERPSQIWVNVHHSHCKVWYNCQWLDNGVVRVRPVRSLDTALVQVINLEAYA